MDNTLIDLTQYSHTYPDFSNSVEIIADSKIRDITHKFCKENQIIIVDGPDGTGKTTLLSQFAKINKTCSFSYFFTDNYWNLRPTYFLTSLCTQMNGYLENNIVNKAIDQYKNIDFDQLKRIFEGLVQRVIEKIKETTLPCYFVIDGIENAFNYNNNIDLIEMLQLPTNSRGLYFLGSINSSSTSKIPFKYISEGPHYFSINETLKYFEGVSISSLQVAEIQEWAGGTPGLLMLAKDLIINSRKSVLEIINEPHNFENLIELQWKSVLNKDEETDNLLALIAYSIVPLQSETISKILGMEQKKVQEKLSQIGFLKIFENASYSFYPVAYKSFSKKRMQKLKASVMEKIIDYYKKLNDKTSKILLPQYLGISEDYNGLKDLLTPEYLSNLVIENNDISLAELNINNSLDLAKKNLDIGAIKFGLAGVQLHEISNQVFGFSEVIALLELKKFDEALDLAYSTNILSNRIRLFSKIYSSMEKIGRTIPRSAIEELNILADQLSNSQNDPELILKTAADLFPVLPDVAARMVDNAKRTEQVETPIELFALMTSLLSEKPESETLLSKVSDENIRDFAISHSPWLIKLSAEEVVKKANSLSVTKAKEYLLRHWCRENPKCQGIEYVIENAINIIISDHEYHVPLRNLRQLSDFLKNCPKEKMVELIKRFETPLFASLQSPVQEKIRLELNFIELLFDIDNDESISRLNNIQARICESNLDTDILCVCLSSLLVTLFHIDPTDNLNLNSCVKAKLENEFLKLLENSASQLDITKQVLRSIAKIDVNLALAFSDILNTVERKDIGTKEVLTSYIRQEYLTDYEDVIKKGLTRISDTKMRENTIQKIVELFTVSKTCIDEKGLDFLKQLVILISDPVIKAMSYSYILTHVFEKGQNQEIYNSLFSAWEEIEISWNRLEVGFSIVGRIAEKHPVFGQDLFDKTKAIKKITSLSNDSIGRMYYDTLRHAAKISGSIYLQQEGKSSLDLFESLVARIPSSTLQLRVQGDIALSLLRNGNKKDSDAIVQDKLIPGLQKSSASNLKSSVISEIAIVLFEYSPEVATAWVNTIPYLKRNITWVKVIIKLLTQSYMCDHYDDELPTIGTNLKVANQVLKIIPLIERDNEIYLSIKLLAHAVANEAFSLTEMQKLDLLTQLENLVVSKLPDKNNILHSGYLVLCLAQIENARWKSAKKLKNTLPKNTNRIIALAKEIDNMADRVLVLGELGVLFQGIPNTNSNQLIDEAYAQVINIHNVKDRFDRLELLADCYGKTQNTSMVTEIMKMAIQITESLEGVEKDKILASLLQTTYQYNKKIASELSERIEDFSTSFKFDQNKKSIELSKSPQKITSCPNNDKNYEILNFAAEKMNKMIASSRNTIITKSTIFDWLSNIKGADYSECHEVIDWVIQSVILQAAESEINSVTKEVFDSLLHCSKLTLLLGGQLSNAIPFPEDLKHTFQGFLVNRKFFLVGENQKAKIFLAAWVKENVKVSILLCDPYFNEEQLWFLQLIPNDVIVKILCTMKGFGYKKNTSPGTKYDKTVLRSMKSEIKDKVMKSWNKISAQDPPNTILIIQNTIFENDEMHDRFILSNETGLSMGASLNSIGKKEFFISTLAINDVNFTYEKYITPKTHLEEDFTNIIYFELD